MVGCHRTNLIACTKICVRGADEFLYALAIKPLLVLRKCMVDKQYAFIGGESLSGSLESLPGTAPPHARLHQCLPQPQATLN